MATYPSIRYEEQPPGLAALARQSPSMRTPDAGRGVVTPPLAARTADPDAGPQSLSQVVRNALIGRAGPAAPTPAAASADQTPDFSGAMNANPALMASNTAAPTALVSTPTPTATPPVASPLSARAVSTPPSTVQPPAAPAQPLSSAAQPEGLPAGVARTGNNFSGANVAAPPGSSAGDSTRPYPLGSMADTQYQTANLRASNASVPQGGLTIIDGAGQAADARQSFFDQANLRNVVNRGPAPGRSGAAAFAQQVEAAQLPLSQRAQQQQTMAEQAGATQRAGLQEQGLAARAQVTDARQQEANSIDRARLGIDAMRAGNSGLPSGYRTKADGNGLEPIPGGPADPSTPKGKNALTEDQAKSAGYAVRMENAMKLINSIGRTNPGATRPGAGTAAINMLPEGVANMIRPEDRQRVEAAQLDALDAALTLNTGAAYTREQLQGMSRAYFAQPGDDDKTVAEKQQRLNSLTDTARLRAGQSGSAMADTAVQTAQQRAGNPAPGASSALPSGMSRQIGTSGGKPVYEDAQGNRFVGG